MKSIRNRFGFVAIGLVASLAVGGTAMGQAGTVVAWGENGQSQCVVPTTLQKCIDLAITFGSVIALQANGTVVGWGDNTWGQTSIPINLGSCSAIAAGWDHVVAIQLDCNQNGVADVDEILSGSVTDINANGIPDSCDVVSGLLNDYNHNGIADSAELAIVTAQLHCGDLDGSGDVGSEDLGMLLLNYGQCEGASLTTAQEPLIFQSVETTSPVLNKK